jgi:SPP1 family predicted phage head-tail adaptor
MAIKLNTFIDIISTKPVKDSEGFATKGDTVLASVRAYFEPKNSTEKWANMAQFSEATAIFKFRKIPGLNVTSDMVIVCDSGRYEILSVEDVRQKGTYIEAIAKAVVGSA